VAAMIRILLLCSLFLSPSNSTKNWFNDCLISQTITCCDLLVWLFVSTQSSLFRQWK
jgi:antibiotic biosynthesis monooxygenase (ABM) superfamily enzyme